MDELKDPPAPKAPAHVHEWRHDDVEPDYPPVSVSTCECGAIRRSWQDDAGEFREEITYMS
ncbi:MAG: hypothetical protein Q8O42_13725 [Acidobacteriota bacterium]|nr:hypothetical protein [Acidobacteriota bacterium]